jgi:hypothetical protein
MAGLNVTGEILIPNPSSWIPIRIRIRMVI